MNFKKIALQAVLLALSVSAYGQLRFSADEAQAMRKMQIALLAIENLYVDTTDTGKLAEDAIRGMISKLDPHSSYSTAKETKELNEPLQGNFDGIGIQFNVPNDTAIVLEVIPGGPSEKAGLQPGDRILKVDSCNIAGVRFPQDSMVRRMKGKAGTEVRILVKRDNAEIPFDITRGKIPVHCVDASFMINDTTGYIKLSKFSRTTYKEVSEAAAGLVDKGMTHLVFDLRDNTGGYFDQALLLSDMFLKKGAPIVYLQGLHRKREDYNADGKGMLQDVKLSVLINENSASSSEILAGAIQDNDRGEIVGRRSFGKGLVQEPVYFTDNSAIRLTVARFHTPSGRCIQKPYGDDYQYDIYKRYADGEMFDRDSIKIDSSEVYKTLGGRTVYGGGGIIPDVFVPMDTTKATPYFIRCNKKTTQMRFASAMFDKYRRELSAIDSYEALDAFLGRIDVVGKFRSYAADNDKIVASQQEWEETLPYLRPQLRALVGRYSKMGDNAFYRLYLEMDDVVKAAL